MVRSLAERSGPAGSDVQVATGGREIEVTVTAAADPVGGLLPSFRVQSTAVALREPEPADEP